MARNVVFLRSMRFLGGHIVTYPLLYQIKHSYPNDELIVVGTDPIAAHYESTPWVDHYIQADTLGQKLKTLKGARRVFVLHHSSEQYAPLTAACHIPTRVSFQNGRFGDFLWTHRWTKDHNEYMALANLNLARQLHDFNPETVARQAMQALAATASEPPPPATDAVFMPGGGFGAYKRWRIQAYVELADNLKPVLGQHATFSFVMGPDEAQEADYIENLQRPDFKLVKNRSMAHVAHVCLAAKIIVANDCGPSHIAQNCCGRYVGVFHEAEPTWFWQRPGATCVTPTNGSNDIQSISAEQVAQACNELLAHAPAAAQPEPQTTP